ncbi:MAG: histidinol-phosphate transaminase [Burkholderiaceae bacterium]|nr:MAG: histidinol-phosphate transaminase [Burkholderiaceae bacterium]
MSRFWSDRIADLAPYTPGEQPKVNGLLKLNTNENPYGPSPRVIEAIGAQADDRLRLYPDPESRALRESIARQHGVEPSQVFVGNGSDEVLAHVFRALFLHGTRPLLMPDITYSFYSTFCQLYQVPYEIIPLADDFSLSISDYTTARAVAPAGIIFANPNAPTGMSVSVADIEAIAAAHPDTPVVVDEAYVNFGCESAIAALGRHENLVVIHTFSKSRSLAGMRVGFAVAGAAIIEGLVRVKDSFNSYPLDRLAQAAAQAAVEDVDYFRSTCDRIVRTRAHLVQQLGSLGMQVLPSQANFVFARYPGVAGASLFASLRQRHILVRHFAQPRIHDFLRITVGTESDCERLCNGLTEILRNAR